MIQIYDIEHNNLVATWKFPKQDDDAIAAFDFANNTFWLIGYVSGSRKAPYLVRELKNAVDFSKVPTDQEFTAFSSSTQIGNAVDGTTHDLQNGTIQDAQYVDDKKIYFCAGGGSDYHRTEYCRVHVYDTTTKTLDDTKMCVESGESEGFVYDTNSQSFLMTTGSSIWKLSAGTGYDTQYNFEPATLVDGYYQIDSASKLLWFKQQVYGGCTDIKAKLTANINMSGVTDPYSYYVYDINMPTKRVYDATNAFTGEFDGQNYTISNYSITKTDYNNDGLFPYCVGATIQNLTVTGTIKLTTCTNSSGTSGSAVSNVGLIGYMDGGTVTGVDVSGLTIDQTVVGTEGTVNKLIGGRGTNEITESGNITTTYTHDSNGHVYKNGFCISEGTCDTPYQTPSTDGSGVYQIANGGELFWFASFVNASTDNVSANAVLTCDLNLDDKAFPGIGSSTYKYTGTFDGQGYSIAGFSLSVTSTQAEYQGLFNAISDATIKNFHITGSITSSYAKYGLGGIVGYAYGTKSLIEDVYSSVAIESTKNIKQAGGIICRGYGTINRCRYNGTIVLSDYDKIGGIIGDIEGSSTTGTEITNCLFDGTITASSKAAKSVGGILGYKEGNQTKLILKHNFSNGHITLSASAPITYCGIIVGQVSGNENASIAGNFYTTTNTKKGTDAFTQSAGAVLLGISMNNKEITNTEDMTDASKLRYWLGVADWKQDTSYPVPAKTSDTHTHTYSDNGFCVSSDGAYEALGAIDADGTYHITKGSDLYGFAVLVNAGTTDAKATVMNNIDMEGVDFPGIGSEAKKYAGTFDGGGYTISGFCRNVVSTKSAGMFNYINGATIQNFRLKGSMVTHRDGSSGFGSVVGNGESGTNELDGVHSSVKIMIFRGTKEVGGIAGSFSGTISHCRYDGTIANDDSKLAFYAIGGICGYSNKGMTISNCLFDGTINNVYTSNNTPSIAGIVGYHNSNALTIKNSLMHGTVTISNSTAVANSGLILGFSAAGDLSVTDNYYTTDNCTIASSALTNIIGTGTTQGITSGCTLKGDDSWTTICTNLNANQGSTDTNWDILDGADYPVPHYTQYVHTHTYDKNGYCTDSNCGQAEPIGDAVDGYYQIDHLADFCQFRDLVNNSDKGTVINAKLNKDVALTNWTINDMIGSEAHPYCGTFDGQGYSITDVNINPSSSTRYVGLFPYVGTTTSPYVAGNIENLSVSGTITNSSYYCNQETDAPLELGVVGDIHCGSVVNVHSSVDYGCTNATRAQVGGVVGGAHLSWSDPSIKVLIDKCSYTGTINVNAYDDIAGILGYLQHNTTVSNCRYDGHIIQAYDASKIPDDQKETTAGLSSKLFTQIGGILGYTSAHYDSEDNSKGSIVTMVTNNLVTGDFTPDADFSYETSAMNYRHTDKKVQIDEGYNDKEYHNINAIVGYTADTKFFANNYLLDTYTVNRGEGKTTTSQLGLGTINSENEYVPTRTAQQFDAGEVCAEMNGNVTDDNPWGQVLGYQLEYNGVRDHDPDSPSELYPSPGYVGNDGTTYEVVKDDDDNYTADYYFYDDLGNYTPYPSDAKSMKVKHIEYTRGACNQNTAYDMSGYNSFCLPFDFKISSMLPTDAKVYKYSKTEGSVVQFVETNDDIEKGTPFIMSRTEGVSKWSQKIENSDGTDVALNVNNPSEDGSTEGLYGVFDTKLLGVNYWKIKYDGTKLVYTILTSKCYPFRVYFKTPTKTGDISSESSNAKSYSLLWLDNDNIATSVKLIDNDDIIPDDAVRYNIMGQKVSSDTKGIVIVNGKKIMIK